MRRLLLPALMISLLLCACGSSAPERKFEEQRKALASAQEITLTADVTANIGDEVFSCTLDCRADGNSAEVAVTAPESIAGIRAAVSPDGTTIEYQGVSLGVGGSGPEAAPVNALPLLLTALRSGSTLRSWTEWEDERTLFVREFYVTDDTGLTVWFDASSLLPVYAEFTRDGAALLRCEIHDFQWRSP